MVSVTKTFRPVYSTKTFLSPAAIGSCNPDKKKHLLLIAQPQLFSEPRVISFMFRVAIRTYDQESLLHLLGREKVLQAVQAGESGRPPLPAAVQTSRRDHAGRGRQEGEEAARPEGDRRDHLRRHPRPEDRLPRVQDQETRP